jgi:tetratricopeptide (TPR) repeat protein
MIDQGRYRAAITQIEQYLTENSQDPQARFLHALALARAGDQGRAIEVFSKLAADFPDLAEPRNNLGVLFAQTGQYDNARQALTEAVRIDPNHGPAQENLGDVHVALAQQAYREAARIENDNRAVRAKNKYLQAMLDNTDKPAGKPPIASAQAGSDVVSSGTASSSASASAAPASDRSGVQINASASRSNAEIIAAVEDWASAWSRQDVDAYLASYGQAFRPDGMSRSAWETQRRDRVSRPDFIRIEISDVRVTPVENEQGDVNVAFEQAYTADNYSDQERKILSLRPVDGQWKIIRETTP